MKCREIPAYRFIMRGLVLLIGMAMLIGCVSASIIIPFSGEELLPSDTLFVQGTETLIPTIEIFPSLEPTNTEMSPPNDATQPLPIVPGVTQEDTATPLSINTDTPIPQTVI